VSKLVFGSDRLLPFSLRELRKYRSPFPVTQRPEDELRRRYTRADELDYLTFLLAMLYRTLFASEPVVERLAWLAARRPHGAVDLAEWLISPFADDLDPDAPSDAGSDGPEDGRADSPSGGGGGGDTGRSGGNGIDNGNGLGGSGGGGGGGSAGRQRGVAVDPDAGFLGEGGELDRIIDEQRKYTAAAAASAAAANADADAVAHARGTTPRKRSGTLATAVLGEMTVEAARQAFGGVRSRSMTLGSPAGSTAAHAGTPHPHGAAKQGSRLRLPHFLRSDDDDGGGGGGGGGSRTPGTAQRSGSQRLPPTTPLAGPGYATSQIVERRLAQIDRRRELARAAWRRVCQLKNASIALLYELIMLAEHGVQCDFFFVFLFFCVFFFLV
jgi:hypothetical protein